MSKIKTKLIAVEMSQYTYDYCQNLPSDYNFEVPVRINKQLFMGDIFNVYSDGSKKFIGW